MLIPITDRSGKQVWVNAFHVRDVKPRKEGCDVAYGPAGHVRTEESAESLVNRINDAMLTANPAALAALMTQPGADASDGGAALGAIM